MSSLLLALALAALQPDPLLPGKPAVLRGSSETVTAVAISADGKLVAAGSRDKTIRVWSLPNGELVRSVVGGEGQLNALAFSADGALLAAGDVGFQVRVVDLKSGEVKATIANPAGVTDVAFSPDGTQLAVGGLSDTGGVYELPSGKRRYEVRGRTVSWSGDGKQLLVANAAGSLLFVDAKSGKVKKSIATTPHLPWATWSKDGKVLLSWNGNEVDVHLWTAAGKAAGVLAGPPSTGFEGAKRPGVRALAVTADGATAAAACADGFVRLWDVKAKAVKKAFPADSLTSVALSADGGWLIVGDGPLVKLWRLAE